MVTAGTSTGGRRVAAWPGSPGVIGFLFCLVAAAVALGKALDRGPNHDENQFVAPALFFLREGWLPYRDFPLFHMPDLVFLYAGAASLFENGFLGIRVSCGIAAAATLCLIFSAIARRGGEPGVDGWRTAVAGGIAVLLLVGSPIFIIASGLSWNHDWPALFTVGAVLVAARGAHGKYGWGWFGLAGFLAGAAAGSRLTFLFIMPPVMLAPFLVTGRTPRWRLAMFLAAGCGGFLSMLPSIYLFAQAPEAFVFGNLQYPRLPLLDPANEQHLKAMVPWRKARFFFKEFAAPNAALFGAFLCVGIEGCVRLARSERAGSALARVLLLAVPFVALGCFVPSRYQEQHFYAPAPLLALATGLALTAAGPRRISAVALAAAISLALNGSHLWRGLAHLGIREEWAPVKLEEPAMSIRRSVGGGSVATLAPMIPMIAGVGVPPELATAPFGWRNAHLIDAERRERLRVAGPEDLDRIIERRKVSAVLVGVEPKALEEALVEAARKRGFDRVELGRKRSLLVFGEGSLDPR